MDVDQEIAYSRGRYRGYCKIATNAGKSTKTAHNHCAFYVYFTYLKTSALRRHLSRPDWIFSSPQIPIRVSVSLLLHSVMIFYAIHSLKINGEEINRSVCRHVQAARRCRTSAVPGASTRAFILQRQPDAYHLHPLRTPPDVVSVYRTNPTQCVQGQPDAYRSRTVRVG